MSNIIEAGFVFFIIIIAGFIAITTLANTHTLAVGNCNYNSSGSLNNCSVSNDDYIMLNNTANMYSQVFVSTAPPITFVLAAGVILALFVGIIAFIKK